MSAEVEDYWTDAYREYVADCAYDGIEPVTRDTFIARRSEAAYERQCEAYYGGCTPQADRERTEANRWHD